jgi:amidase
MDAILTYSARHQAELVRRGKISPAELFQLHLERIADVNPRINAAVQVLDYREPSDGPLRGVPFSIKDSIELAGTGCTAGTWGRRAAAASTRDAALVADLLAAGAIPVARTNLPDLLFAFESDNLLFGRTNNPYDATRTSGGSSGGEAALIAACGSPLGLGSDAAGSVRLPAAFCGIASIKPTSGGLAREGHFPAASGWIEALWQIGPMARHVEDLYYVVKAPKLASVGPLRIAFYTDNGFAAADEEVSAVVRAAAEALARDAALVAEDRPRCLAAAYHLEMKLLGPDGGDSLREYLTSLGSTRIHRLLNGWLKKLEAYRTDLRGFQQYWAEWDAYREEMRGFMERYDAIVCPAYIHPALAHSTSTGEDNFHGFSHTMAYNVAGWPAAVVRCGESRTGLPIAVQVAAAPKREDIALGVAMWLEQAFGGWKAPIAL